MNEVILSVQGLTKEFSGQRLFEPVSFVVRKNDRTAILGPNGTGKTTLIKMILGQMESSQGQIITSKGLTIGSLSQDVIQNPENTLYEEAMDVFQPLIQEEKELHKLSERISQEPQNEALLNEYSRRLTDFENKDGYSYQYKIDMILNMFSFTKEDRERKIKSFSGGEKTRVAFAKLLMSNPENICRIGATTIKLNTLEKYFPFNPRRSTPTITSARIIKKRPPTRSLTM